MEVAVEGKPGPDGFIPNVRGSLYALLLELDLRDLNKMVVGAHPTPEGIAAWALERLRLELPGLQSVSVGFEGYAATAEV